MKVINLLAGPGAGKSTIAAGLFHQMKVGGYKVELVTEFAKELVFEGRSKTLKNQAYIFGKQLQKMERMRDSVDVIITDSPLLLSAFYLDPASNYPKSFEPMVVDFFNTYENFTYFIKRPAIYQQYGRLQNLEEAIDIDSKIIDFLNLYNISFTEKEATPTIHLDILKDFE